jgi:outer membrane protein TolC
MDGLLVLLGLQVGGLPELVTTVAYAPEALDPLALTAQALETRPDLRLADLSIEDREAVVRIARSFRLPTLDLFADWTRQRDGLEERSWLVGLDLSVPIASRSLSEAVRQASWDLLVSKQAKEELKQRIVADVRRQVRAAGAARANVDIAEKGLEVAKRSLFIAQRMVEEGLATNRDVLDAQDEIRRSESQLATSKIDYYLSLVRLRVAIGEDVMALRLRSGQGAGSGRAQRAADASTPDSLGPGSPSEGGSTPPP